MPPDIWMAETRKDAETEMEAYGPKYEKATACLTGTPC